MAARRLFVRLDEDLVHGPETAAPAGSLRAMPVDPALRACVSHVLLYRESIAKGEEIVERVVPDGALRLVCEFGHPAASGAGDGVRLVVIGPSASPALVRLRGHVRGLSLTLRPGAALSLLGTPAGELADAQVPLDQLWTGRQYRLLVDGLAGCRSDVARLGVLQRALLGGRRRHATSEPAVHAWRSLVLGTGRITVRAVALDTGLSERRLQQLFHGEVGLSPRTWRRLARLHGCIRGLRVSRASWAALAADHGYYDQPHMIREFRALCGCTPAEFVREGISHSSNTAA